MVKITPLWLADAVPCRCYRHHLFTLLIMLKGNLLKVIGETAKDAKLTRIEKFQVFCNVCDNMLAEGRITKVQHERWTNVF